MDRGPATVTQVAAGAGAITKAAPEALNEYSCPVSTTINVIQLPIAWHLCMPLCVKCQECLTFVTSSCGREVTAQARVMGAAVHRQTAGHVTGPAAQRGPTFDACAARGTSVRFFCTKWEGLGPIGSVFRAVGSHCTDIVF